MGYKPFFYMLLGLSLLSSICFGGEKIMTSEVEITFGATNFAPNTEEADILKHYQIIEAPLFTKLGATSFESYVRWSALEKEEEIWDYSLYDLEIEYLKKNNLKWVPFLIAGPAYTTPEWFKKSKESVFYKCLEHNIESEVQSIWNPNLSSHIEQFISHFAEHYSPKGVIESVLLGITGDFGEAIYPVTGGGWTGNYHQHQGFWCADEYAVRDFRRFLKSKYRRIEQLNKRWKSNYNSFKDIYPLLKENAVSDYAWLEQVGWYREKMLNWADLWLKTTRHYFPDTKIYLCTGGDGHPAQGSDFGRQVKVAAKYKAGIRITNEGSYYPANFCLTRWVASAAKFYRTFYGFEPAAAVTDKGLVRRIYNVTSSGATQLFEYSGNVTSSDLRKRMFFENKRFIKIREPLVIIAVLIPQTYLTINPSKWHSFFEELFNLRDLIDFDFVDENMIKDGALSKYQTLIIGECNLIDDEAAKKIINWVKSGNILFGYNLNKIFTLSGKPFLLEKRLSISSLSLSKLAVKLKEGYIISVPKNIEEKLLISLLSQLFFFPEKLDSKFIGIPPIDTQFDKVFLTILSDGLALLNASDDSWERQITLELSNLKRLGVKKVPPKATLNLKVEPQSILIVDF